MYLNCHTWYSFKYGTLSPETLFEEAKKNNVRKLVLTEINNTCSYVEMLRHCKEKASEYLLDVAVGVECRRENTLLYILIAKNNNGFEEINRFLSHHNITQQPLPARAPQFRDVFCIYPWIQSSSLTLRDDEYFGIRSGQVTKLMFNSGYKIARHKYVILHPVTFSGKIGFSVHKVLRAIDNNVVLSKLAPNDQADSSEVMLPAPDLAKKYEVCPDIISNTEKMLSQCSIEVEFGVDKNKKDLSGSEESDFEMLRTQAWEGFKKRYDANNPTLCERFERELMVIRKKKFCSYYLIAYDLVQFAARKGFEHVGRGSGANSVIAFCLGITNVDPIELNLYFERFLNEERVTPSDFDLDFSWRNRDEVYAYLFSRYGDGNICLLGSVTTFQGNSIIREVGKVFGLPKHEIDELAENPHAHRRRDVIAEKIIACVGHLKEMPSHLSIHAGGILITDKPLYRYGTLDLPPKNFPVIQMDMYSAEDLGLYKLDVLSQRGLGHIKDTVSLVKKTRNIAIDIDRFDEFKKDEKVKSLLRSSKAMGCFYIESPAMRMLIAKLQCDDYLTLVAASSIIRPGVARSGMMKAYIERYHAVRNGGTYETIHPKMRELMAETYGVMVYQEDVIKVAHEFANLSLTEADVLRRAMSGKYRSRKAFDDIRDKFFYNCRQQGYDPKVSERVWYEIESFSGYSFAKGHSASYAVESYQSLFLKAYYPLEFIVSVINNFGGFYKTEFYFHEARMLGATVEAPCINHSDYNTSLRGAHIYMGFVHVKSLEEKIITPILEERDRHGEFVSMHDFLRRVRSKLEQVTLLIQIGAFRFTGKTKQVLKWEAMLFFGNVKQRLPAAAELFASTDESFDLPDLESSPYDDAFDEIELLGFPLCNPFDLLQVNNQNTCAANDLKKSVGQTVIIIGYVVDIKNTQTRQGQPMHFGAFYDCTGVFFDTVHFPNVAKEFPFRGKGFYKMKGTVIDDFGIPVIDVAQMEKLPMVSPKFKV